MQESTIAVHSLKTPTEELVAKIWSKVLLIEEESIHRFTDFFSIGGDSLKAIMVQVRIYELAKIEISIGAIFENPELVNLCGAIDSLRTTGNNNRLIEKHKRFGFGKLFAIERFPASEEQMHLWRIIRDGKVKIDVTNIPLVVDLYGCLDVQSMIWGIQKVFSRQSSLRTRIETIDDNPMQVIDPPAKFFVSQFDVSCCESPEKAADELVDRIVWKDFEISRDRLFRVAMIKIGQSITRIAISFHHIICDGWSTGTFAEDICFLYNAKLKGEGDTLPNLTCDYIEYTKYRKQWMQSREAQEHKEYWIELLQDAPPPPALYKGGCEKLQNGKGASSLPITIPVSTVILLGNICRNGGASLFMGLLAAFKICLSRWTGQLDVAIYSAVAGRSSSELEKLMGTFARVLVLRTSLNRDMSYPEALAAVKRTCLDAYAHQEVPSISPVLWRSRGGVPVSRISFQLQNYQVDNWSLDGLLCKQIEVKPPPDALTPLGDMVIELKNTGTDIQGSVVYSHDAFDNQTMQNFLICYLELLEAIVVDPVAVKVISDS